MTITPAQGLHLRESTRRRLLLIGAWAGIAGPILFTIGFLAQDLARDGYNPVAQPVSALAAGPHGWIQGLNFVVFGVLTLLFAVGMHLGIRTTRAGVIGPALLFVSGLGLLWAAVFPLRADATGTVYDPGGHVIGGMMFFPVTALALLLLAGRIRQDPRWRSIALFTLVSGLLGVAGVVISVTLTVPDTAVGHDVAGLVQRLLVLTAFFPCRVVLALRLLRVSRSGAPVLAR
jgi:hypothetical membrane protein